MRSESSATLFTDFGIQNVPSISLTGRSASWSYQGFAGGAAGAGVAVFAPAVCAALPACLSAVGALGVGGALVSPLGSALPAVGCDGCASADDGDPNTARATAIVTTAVTPIVSTKRVIDFMRETSRRGGERGVVRRRTRSTPRTAREILQRRSAAPS